MAQLLIIHDDPAARAGIATTLRDAGHHVVTASSGTEALELLAVQPMDGVVSRIQLPDTSVETALTGGADENTRRPDRPSTEQQAHAARRLANVTVPVLDAAADPRTICGWSRLVFVSRGTLRNWCRTAGVSPRRALVFARLLRAVVRSEGGKHAPENLLDVVDRRTLVALVACAGLDPAHPFPVDVEEFLERQTLFRDPDLLNEIEVALRGRLGERLGHAMPAVL